MAVLVRDPLVDDDGSGTTGTVLNNAWYQQFCNRIDAALGGGSNGATQVKSGDYTLLNDDLGVHFTGAATCTLPAIASVDNRIRFVSNGSVGLVTIDPFSTQLIWDRFTVKTLTRLGPGEALAFAKLDANTWQVVARSGLTTRCLVTRAAAQTIASGVLTKIQFTTEAFDTFSEWDSSTNFQWTASEAMEIVVHGQAYLSGVGLTGLHIYKNGVAMNNVLVSGNGGEWCQQAFWQGSVGAADTIALYVIQYAGSDKSVTPGQSTTFLSIRRTS